MRRLDTFTFKCSEEERRMIDALARKLERTPSDAIRVTLRRAAVDAGAWFEQPESANWRGRPDSEQTGCG